MLFPKIENARALDKVNDNAGVVVGVATDVVNNGDKVPAEKFVTVPSAAFVQAGIPAPVEVRTCPGEPTVVEEC